MAAWKKRYNVWQRCNYFKSMNVQHAQSWEQFVTAFFCSFSATNFCCCASNLDRPRAQSQVLGSFDLQFSKLKKQKMFTSTGMMRTKFYIRDQCSFQLKHN